MKKQIGIALIVCSFCGCETKTPDVDEEPSTAAQHVNTNRAGFKAAGKAAKQIENKGEDRLKAADEAMNAGK